MFKRQIEALVQEFSNFVSTPEHEGMRLGSSIDSYIIDKWIGLVVDCIDIIDMLDLIQC